MEQTHTELSSSPRGLAAGLFSEEMLPARRARAAFICMWRYLRTVTAITQDTEARRKARSVGRRGSPYRPNVES